MRKHGDMATLCCSLLIGTLAMTAVLATAASDEPSRARQNTPSWKDSLLRKSTNVQVNGIRQHWKVRGDQDSARRIYRVMTDNGNCFLHAYADQQAIQIGLTHTFSPQEFPLLRWCWCATQLPPGADEGRQGMHDSAAGVYVIFDNNFLPQVIKYVWSTTLPVGSRVQNPLYSRAKVVVPESGASALGQWRQETVNFARDYQELFGQSPGPVQGIGLQTSSTFTKSVAIADYDDFTLLNLEALLAEGGSGSHVQQAPTAKSGQ